ncbi:MAG: hypothetical protein R2728_16370 [Chitinophagales bacterium]
MTKKATKNGWPLDVEWGLIGSCTNSPTKIYRGINYLKQAVDKGLTTKAKFRLIQDLSKLDLRLKEMVCWKFLKI